MGGWVLGFGLRSKLRQRSCEKKLVDYEIDLLHCPGDGKICAAKIGGIETFSKNIPWFPQRDAGHRRQNLIRKYELA